MAMWTCPNCREVLEDQFDACWQCGCTREGKLNLEFIREPKPPSDASSWESKFEEHFKCPKCGHREAIGDRIAGSGVGLAKAFSSNEFLAVSCNECGYTEFYNLSILEGRSNLDDFLRRLFGG
jgi:predicted nucleic-acid-binding Zn-ribbon protein